MVNVFVAVVLKNFEEEVMSDPKNTTNPISRDVVIQFGNTWSSFNPTSLMDPDGSKLEDFLETLEPPLGSGLPHPRRAALLHLIFVPVLSRKHSPSRP